MPVENCDSPGCRTENNARLKIFFRYKWNDNRMDTIPMNFLLVGKIVRLSIQNLRWLFVKTRSSQGYRLFGPTPFRMTAETHNGELAHHLHRQA